MSKRSRRIKRRGRRLDREKAGREITPRVVKPQVSPDTVLAVYYTSPKPAPDKAIAWGIGTLAALLVAIGTGYAVKSDRLDPCLHLGVPAMLGLMVGTATGIFWWRISSNTFTPETRRNIRKEGLWLCLAGIAGIVVVSACTFGLVFLFAWLGAPLGVQRLTMLLESFCVPCFPVIISGLARLIVADEQALNA